MSGVRALGSGHRFVDEPTTEPVDVEWLSVCHEKAGPRQLEQERDLSPQEAFIMLSQNARGKATILFIPGGGRYQHGPGTYRDLVGEHSQDSGARVVQLDYRLCPQTAFPGQLCDLLLTYLTILYPPDGSAHQPIDPSSVVVAGDSCGGKLALALGQLIIELRHQQQLPPSEPPTVIFNSKKVILPLPAGILTLGAGSDASSTGLLSWQRNRQHDIWPEEAPFVQSWWPSDSI